MTKKTKKELKEAKGKAKKGSDAKRAKNLAKGPVPKEPKNKKAEKSAPKNKAAKAKRQPPKRDHSNSNKAQVYTAWKKSRGKETPEKLHKMIKGNVKLSTITNWIRRWNKGKGLPAIAKK